MVKRPNRALTEWAMRVRVLPLEGPPAPDRMVSVGERDALERALRRLYPEHRAVFVTVTTPLGSDSCHPSRRTPLFE